MNRDGWIEAVTRSRAALPEAQPPDDGAAEGGCGVIGFASTVPVAGRHLLQALEQMRNRGNGKGGGIAAVGLDPAQFGVDIELLEQGLHNEPQRLQRELQEAIDRVEADHPEAQVIVLGYGLCSR
ncbi:MAG: DUF1638 domain-containing protein, partial [Candidatus Poseidoniia archaeon]|nr:DUF1638 domain-containing protein [Candidatus Poseidoniia archaeon]